MAKKRRDLRESLIPRILLRETKSWRAFPRVGKDDPAARASRTVLLREYKNRRKPDGRPHARPVDPRVDQSTSQT
jgi:hypothetical protein